MGNWITSLRLWEGAAAKKAAKLEIGIFVLSLMLQVQKAFLDFSEDHVVLYIHNEVSASQEKGDWSPLPNSRAVSAATRLRNASARAFELFSRQMQFLQCAFDPHIAKSVAVFFTEFQMTVDALVSYDPELIVSLYPDVTQSEPMERRYCIIGGPQTV